MSSTPNAISLYTKAKNLAPNGIKSDKFLPILLDGFEFKLLYFTNKGNGNDVVFSLFLDGGRYSRKDIIVWEDGKIEEPDGIIPDFDLLDNEPSINLSLSELASLYLNAIEMVEHSKCSGCGNYFKEGDLLQVFLKSPDMPNGSWLKEPVVVDAEFQMRSFRNNDKLKRYHPRCITKE